MKGRFALVRRSAGALGISLAMLVAAGTGAGAAGTVSLTNYTASAMSQTLGLDVTLPALAGDLAHIHEAISFASSLSQWSKTPYSIKGKGLARVLDGNVISTPTTESAVNQQNQKLGKNGAVLAVDLPSGAPIVSVGVGKTAATAGSAVSTATSTSYSSLASIDISLKNLAKTSQAAADLVETLQTTLNGDANQSGLIDTVNKQLTDLGLAVQLTEPNLAAGEILHVGLMEAETSTGLEGALRVAKAVNTLTGVRLLDSLVKIDLIKVEATAKLDALGNVVKDGVSAKTTLGGVKIGNQSISLGSDGVTINGEPIAGLPTQIAQLEQALSNLVVDVAGIKIEALKNVTENKAGRAFAQANSLKVTVAPTILNNTLFSVVLQAPVAQAGVDAGNTQVLPRKLSRTGVADTAYLILGPVLLGAAVLVRRFALSR